LLRRVLFVVELILTSLSATSPAIVDFPCEVLLRSFFFSLFTFFVSLGAWGALLIAVLDSSMIFFLPFAVDATVIILAAQTRNLSWFYSIIFYPAMAAAGSLIGAAATFWIGRKIGEKGIEAFVPEKRAQKIKDKVREKGAIAMALPALIPPPFPFTPFILACGALDVSKKRFFSTLATMRLLRFSGEGALAFVYGRRITRWLQSNVFQTFIAVLIVIAIIGTAYSIYKLIKSTRSRRATGGEWGPNTKSA